MNNEGRTKDELTNEVERLRLRVSELEASKTKPEEADKALKESEDKYRTLLKSTFEAIPDLLSVHDRNLHVVLSNWHGHEYVPIEDRVGKPYCYSVYMNRETPCEPCHALEVFETGKSKRLEKKNLVDGITREISVYPIFDESGNVAMVTEHIRDISELKQADEALRKAERERAAILDSIGELVVYLDEEQRILWANRTSGEAAGMAPEELIGRHCYEIWQQRDDPCENCPTIKSLETGQPQEGEMTTPDGKTWFVRGYPVRDERDKITGVVEVARDISEKKIMTEELVKAKKLESVGILAGGIAHDFNNLLSIIMGNISMAKMDMTREDGAHEFLDQAEKASLRAKDLTHRLITFSKGGEPIKKMDSITGLLKDSINLALCDTDVDCEFSFPDDLWPVDHDASQIKHVINNVIKNGVDAMPGGGVIKVSAENYLFGGEPRERSLPLQEGSYVKISIRDQGAGISQEHLPNIFDPYFSTKERGVQKGMGLGLATAYSIIRKHDGAIVVESQAGAGTAVYIYLPAAVAESEAQGAQRLDNSSQSAIQRVLVMDDEEMLRNLAEQMLGRLGYETELAKDGIEAIQLYKRAKETGAPFDAVILDFTIKGGMGGKEAIKELLKIDPHVKAIISSGYSYDPIMSDFRGYGFRGALPKPYRMKGLEEVLQKVLSERTQALRVVAVNR